MDFTFSPEHVALRRMVREFAENEVAPLAMEIDREGRVPFETLRKLAKIGLLGVCFPQEYGGMGAGETGYCILMEELGRVCTSTATNVGAHIGIGAMAIYLDGTEEQKRKYLTPLARGEKIAAFVLTEANAGSDAAAIRTRAVREGDSWILDGTKTFNTNGSFADIVTVLAVTDPALGARGGITAFIVESDTPGFKVGTHENKMGIRGSSTAELIFEEVRVPHENVLGKVGEGFVSFMKTLDMGRLTLGAACLGGAQAALEAAIYWAKTRKQFGVELAHKQSVQWMIANMATEIEALRSLIYRAAWLVDTGRPFTQLAAMCKLYGSEVASRAIDMALQIHGGLGYTRDYPVERAFRDARIAEIFEGTNEIQRIVIASRIFREHGVRIRP
ncbi:MAG: acyl-CoA dehydrogenase [Chloroflexi bacterium]|nr:MAG: acyl-CoA dehydrogenase [Chloroflexota bacterium]RLC84373.1 MAG: acyl-CoA dehydrogenase [Chloroflexota bacterium]HEY67460.1 acyl-CoA dehydrogenase [Thermoflexia bacterium]